MKNTMLLYFFIVTIMLGCTYISSSEFEFELKHENINKEKSMNFLFLPEDIITTCLDYFDGENYKNIKTVCSSLYSASQNKKLLLPQDEEELKSYILKNFNRVLFICKRSAVNPLSQKLLSLAQNMQEQNNHYIFSSIETCDVSNFSWEICYKALYIGAYIGDPQAQKLLQDECERKKRRLEKYKDYLRDTDNDEFVHLFCWEQVSLFNDSDRTSLITAYEAGTSGITCNLQRAMTWKSFDWKNNSFSSFFKLS